MGVRTIKKFYFHQKKPRTTSSLILFLAVFCLFLSSPLSESSPGKIPKTSLTAFFTKDFFQKFIPKKLKKVFKKEEITIPKPKKTEQKSIEEKKLTIITPSTYIDEEFWGKASIQDVKTLLKTNKKYLHIKDKVGRNAFFYAVLYGQHVESLSLLINAGVDHKLVLTEGKFKKGSTALHYALSLIRKENGKSYEFVQTLLKMGFDINALTSINGTPLMHATLNRIPPKTIKLLLKKKANVNATTKVGNTALIVATMPHPFESSLTHINPKTIKLLLEAGADINIENKKGETALDYMTENKDFKNHLKSLFHLKTQ